MPRERARHQHPGSKGTRTAARAQLAVSSDGGFKAAPDPKSIRCLARASPEGEKALPGARNR
eukprot:3124366-Alexandrium_andersonii.AAC.1